MAEVMHATTQGVVLRRLTPLGEDPLMQVHGAVRLMPAPAACRFILRGNEAAPAGGKAFGLALPREACRAAVAGERAALWLGPDEWLLIAPEVLGPAIADAIAQALAARPHSLVDVSHRQTAIDVSGPRAGQLINAACPLDLELASFPVGMCTRTVLAKAEIVLWRHGAEAFRVEIWRSFASYVVQLLTEASFGLTNP